MSRAATGSAGRRGTVAGIATAVAAIGLFAAALHRGLDNDRYLRDLSADDSFRYYTIARNLAAGAGSTFDGLQPTNGYHPAWAVLLSPIWAAGLDGMAAVRVAKLLELLLLAGGTALFGVLLARRGRHALAIVAIASFWLGRRELYDGMEGGLHLFALVLAAAAVVRVHRLPDKAGAWLWLGAASGALCWVRLESALAGLLLPPLAAPALGRSRPPLRRLRLDAAPTPTAAPNPRGSSARRAPTAGVRDAGPHPAGSSGSAPADRRPPPRPGDRRARKRGAARFARNPSRRRGESGTPARRGSRPARPGARGTKSPGVGHASARSDPCLTRPCRRALGGRSSLSTGA